MFVFSSCKHELSIFVPALIGLIYGANVSLVAWQSPIDPFIFKLSKLDCFDGIY